MTPSRAYFLRLFQSLIGVTCFSGCDDSVVDLRSGLSGQLCGSDGEVPLVRGLKPAEPADLVVLRRGFGSLNEVKQTSGECQPAQCELLAATTPSDEAPVRGFARGFDGKAEHLAVLRGEEVELLFTVDELRAFLGVVDTPAEAALLVHADGKFLDCDGPNLEVRKEGFVIYAESGSTCGSDLHGHLVWVHADGSFEELDEGIVERGDKDCVIGRLPAGLCPERPRSRRVRGLLGRYFERISRLEAAAVAAFEDLARELEEHGAPAALVNRARHSARQEARHALLTGALARRHGGARSVPEIVRRPVRSRFEIALDNAREGLTRETYGALVGHHQAAHARTEAVREVMRSIARDETEHAEFSWQLHRWCQAGLSSAERAAVAREAHRARDAFRASLSDPPPALRLGAGLPSESEARRLFDGLFSRLDASAISLG